MSTFLHITSNKSYLLNIAKYYVKNIKLIEWSLESISVFEIQFALNCELKSVKYALSYYLLPSIIIIY